VLAVVFAGIGVCYLTAAMLIMPDPADPPSALSVVREETSFPAVPEPGTLVLIGAGMCWIIRRRRRPGKSASDVQAKGFSRSASLLCRACTRGDRSLLCRATPTDGPIPHNPRAVITILGNVYQAS
jgi:hypothetical protein